MTWCVRVACSSLTEGQGSDSQTKKVLIVDQRGRRRSVKVAVVEDASRMDRAVYSYAGTGIEYTLHHLACEVAYEYIIEPIRYVL